MKNFSEWCEMKEENKIKRLFELTEPVLFAEDVEQIHGGVWRRVRRHKKLVKARFAMASLAILFLAGTIAYKGFFASPENEINLAYFVGQAQLTSELAKLPLEDVIFNMLGNEGETMLDAIMTEQYAVEFAFTLLSDDEQQKIILELQDF